VRHAARREHHSRVSTSSFLSNSANAPPVLFDAALTRTSTSPKASRSPPAAATAKGRLRSNANILRAVIDLTIRGDEGDAPLAAREPWEGARARAGRARAPSAVHAPAPRDL
jgi:hypothetical protein